MAHIKDECVTRQEGEEAAPSRLGRVEVDARGRNVWRWARNLAESTSVLLKRLETSDLEIEATQQVKARIDKQRPRRAAAALTLEGEDGRDAGGGFDPYNRR